VIYTGYEIHPYAVFSTIGLPPSVQISSSKFSS